MKQKSTFAVLVSLLVLLSMLGASAGFAAPAQRIASDAVQGIAPSSATSTTDGSQETGTTYSHRLIVELQSAPLAAWAAQTGRSRAANGRLQVNTPEAQQYIARLQAEQAAFVNALQRVLPTASVATYINESGIQVQSAYQVVFNGMAIDPGTSDLKAAMQAIQSIPGVKGVYHDYAHQPDLYASVPLINAPVAWNNSVIGGMDNAGAGIKVASMDGGVHHAAPMFDGTGYKYPDNWPLGGLGDAQNNNGKIIASRAYFRPWDPPAPGDENTWPGENGTPHGVHTTGIMAGDVVTATYAGVTVPNMSGVAPKSWIMSYRVFYASSHGIGSFYDAEGIAALEDIAVDGADVLNNSWGGGPTSVGGEFDPLDQALINTAKAGVFISMSAGNSGPGKATTDHPSNDYINVAASTTTGTYAVGRFSVSAPQPVTDTLKNIPYGTASFGASLPIGGVFTYNYKTSASVDPTNITGCAPFPTGAFDGVAAVVKRGGCYFGNKVYYAQQAGATFVVIYNNESGGNSIINMSFGCDYAPGCAASDITIPSIFVGNTAGQGIVEWYTTNGSAAQFTVDNTAYQIGNHPDVIADFSSRGPGVGNVLKPEIAAPGVNILSHGYTPGATGEARHLGWGQASGTSMSAPHVTGAAALIRQIHPDWTNAEIKSALMSTSKYVGVYVSDGSHAQPLDMGAGRLDLTNAADPGVMLDPPALSFGTVPTGTTKTITFTVRSIASASETYTVSAVMITATNFLTPSLSALPGFSVSPSSITLAPGESAQVAVTFDPATGMGMGDNQGYIVLDGAAYDAHLPAWARVTYASKAADVLIIDNDFSTLLGYPDYTAYYSETLAALGYTFDIMDVDLGYALNGFPASLLDTVDLMQYDAVLYFTGDHYQPDGTYSVHTPLSIADTERLTEYANNGGIVIAMGQDMAAVLQSDQTDNGELFYSFVLGANWLQDSVTGNALPDAPVTSLDSAPPAFQGFALDLSGASARTNGLYGVNEVPPVATDAWGEVSSLLYPDGTLNYTVKIYPTTPITLTAAHIHSGTMGTNGGVLFNIAPFTAPTYITDTYTFSGQVSLDVTQTQQAATGGLYVNIHTYANPGGELRGQVVPGLSGDGAENQAYIDEIENTSGGGYMPLLRYQGPHVDQDGVVAMAHRDHPSLERPGISYYGRSVYTTFGLEGVNGAADRADLLGTILDWAFDEATATISDDSGSLAGTSDVTQLKATYSSNIPGAYAVSYRWDFGDGSAYSGPFVDNFIGHTYAVCGTYTVRVEVTDNYGNVTIGSMEMPINRCAAHLIYLPFIGR
ncbi:MAG: hypothetical protein Fur0018_11910 [Anaerolineales bacterium]